jgi:hypothetical protein
MAARYIKGGSEAPAGDELADRAHHRRGRNESLPNQLRAFNEMRRCAADGLVAEWLRRGLQILVRGFDSLRGLH